MCLGIDNTKIKRPKNFRQNRISKEVKQIILEIRHGNPTYSKAKLNAIIKRDYENIKISESSIDKILKELSQKSLIMLKAWFI